MYFALTRFFTTGISLFAITWVVRPQLSAFNTPSGFSVLKMAIPYGLSDFLVLIYMQADVTLLTIMRGSEAAGLYSPASGLINALFIIPSSIYQLTIPILAREFKTNSYLSRRSIQRLSVGFLVLGIILALGVGLFGGLIIRFLLGPKFYITSSLLTILSPLLFIKSLGFAWAAILVTVGWQKRRLIPQAISAISNVILNILTIPLFGLTGVAMVYLISEIILSAGYGGLALNLYHKIRGAN